jgi:vitamin K-dependent gamma-carboxylase
MRSSPPLASGTRFSIPSRGLGLAAWLARPVDAAGVGAFRLLFGLLMVGAVVRFVAKGWVKELYLDPVYHFTYVGFDWVRPLSPTGMALLFALMGCAALFVALGAFTRTAAFVFFLAFTYVELIDQAAYLNHYYLVSLLALLFTVLPVSRAYALDARRPERGAALAATVPRWVHTLLRVQIGLVYVFAGLAKLNHDWLFEAQPLRLWLGRFVELPLVGPLLALPATAYVMSWVGAAFDLLIVPLLLYPRTRKVAYLVALVFHGLIWLLFPIGIFSFLMLVCATLFFEPSWPRALVARFRKEGVDDVQGPDSRATPTRPLPPALLVALGVYLAIQVAVPLRLLLYPGASSWTEEGFRFAWRVMLTEKTGHVEFEIVHPSSGRRVYLNPRSELTPLQYAMMSTQPDLIHAYAHHVAKRYEAAGLGRVRVHAHAWAALNGRPSQRLIDPNVDLAAEARTLLPKRFIVPLRS